MNRSPLISVIVPVYKVEEYLPLCVDLILAQTYQHLEIILVNDGSPDSCGKICDEYAAKDKRVVVIHKENGGLSDARNAGLDICKGEYISFVDSDDQIHPQFIELLYENIIKGDADLAFCSVIKFADNEDLSSIINTQLYSGDTVMYDRATIFDDLLFGSRFLYEHLVAWNKLYKRKIWDTLRYPKGRIHEDVFVIHHILDLSEKVIFVDSPLYFYRQREGSIMAEKRTVKQILDMYDALEDRKQLFKKINVDRSVLNSEQKRLLFDRAIIIGDSKLKNEVTFSKILSDDLSVKTKTALLLKRYSPGLFHFLFGIFKSLPADHTLEETWYKNGDLEKRIIRIN